MTQRKALALLVICALLITVNFFIMLLIYSNNQDVKVHSLQSYISCPTNFSTSGNSMYPTIKDEDEISVDVCFPVENLKVGDLIVFRWRKIYVSHRILSIDSDRRVIQTFGDNNGGYADYPISFYDYYGKIIEVYSISPSGEINTGIRR